MGIPHPQYETSCKIEQPHEAGAMFLPLIRVLTSSASFSLLYSSIPSKSFSFLWTVTWRISSGLDLLLWAAAWAAEKQTHGHTHTLSLWPSGAALQSSFLFSCYLPAPGPSSCRSWAASSASSRSSPASPPALWDPAGRHRAASENGKQESGRESGSSGCCSIAHQVVIGEPRDLLLDAVLHLSLWRQRHHVAELFLLILDVTLQQLDLSVKGLQLVFVLPGLSLQLSLQQPGRTGRTRVLLTDTENNKTPKQTKKQTKTQQNTAQTDQWWYSQCVKHPLRAKTHFH